MKYSHLQENTPGAVQQQGVGGTERQISHSCVSEEGIVYDNRRNHHSEDLYWMLIQYYCSFVLVFFSHIVLWPKKCCIATFYILYLMNLFSFRPQY